jgi:hypothetical protein
MRKPGGDLLLALTLPTRRPSTDEPRKNVEELLGARQRSRQAGGCKMKANLTAPRVLPRH